MLDAYNPCDTALCPSISNMNDLLVLILPMYMHLSSMSPRNVEECSHTEPCVGTLLLALWMPSATFPQPVHTQEHSYVYVCGWSPS